MDKSRIDGELTQFDNMESEFRAASDHSPNEFTNGTMVAKVGRFKGIMFSGSGRKNCSVKSAYMFIIWRLVGFMSVHPWRARILRI